MFSNKKTDRKSGCEVNSKLKDKKIKELEETLLSVQEELEEATQAFQGICKELEITQDALRSALKRSRLMFWLFISALGMSGIALVITKFI